MIWPAPRVRFAPGADGSGWLGWGERDPVPVIPVQIGGQRHEALVDSGAQASVVDQGLAASLGAELVPVPVVAFGVSGAPQVGKAANLSVTVGGLELEGLRTALLDLSPLRRASGRQIALVIGMNALSELALDLDVPRRRLAFRPKEAPPPPGALAVPARLERRELMLPVAIEGRSVELVLDTGASSPVSLSEETARSLGLLDGRAGRSAPTITFGGAAVHRAVQLERLDFAGQTATDVEAQIYPVSAGSPLPAGLLGVGALDRVRLFAAFGAGQLHVLPEPAPEPPQARRRRRSAT